MSESGRSSKSELGSSRSGKASITSSLIEMSDCCSSSSDYNSPVSPQQSKKSINSNSKRPRSLPSQPLHLNLTIQKALCSLCSTIILIFTVANLILLQLNWSTLNTLSDTKCNLDLQFTDSLVSLVDLDEWVQQTPAKAECYEIYSHWIYKVSINPNRERRMTSCSHMEGVVSPM